nr:aldehyde oxidase GLOX1-like [Ipomoea trifida]GMC71412.1 aldehyde oxidase GLOX1-like [Ipomoea batatas]
MATEDPNFTLVLYSLDKPKAQRFTELKVILGLNYTSNKAISTASPPSGKLAPPGL